jgi:hypothetical protein
MYAGCTETRRRGIAMSDRESLFARRKGAFGAAESHCIFIVFAMDRLADPARPLHLHCICNEPHDCIRAPVFFYFAGNHPTDPACRRMPAIGRPTALDPAGAPQKDRGQITGQKRKRDNPLIKLRSSAICPIFPIFQARAVVDPIGHAALRLDRKSPMRSSACKMFSVELA